MWIHFNIIHSVLLNNVIIFYKSLDSSVRSEQELDDRCSILDKSMISFFITNSRPGSGAHTANYPLYSAIPSSGIKRLEREADHSQTSNIEYSLVFIQN